MRARNCFKLREEPFDALVLIRIERVERHGARAAIDHDARFAMLLPQTIRSLDLLFRAGQIFPLRLWVLRGGWRAEAMPENADEYVPRGRMELIEDDLLRAAHVRHDRAPINDFEHDAEMLGQRLEHQGDRLDFSALGRHIRRRRGEDS